MPSSKDQFPDPWDPNSAPLSSDSEEVSKPVEEDFGLSELQELLGIEAETPQHSEMVFDELEGLFPSEESVSVETNFDDLFASLGLESAAHQPAEEGMVADRPEMITNFDVSVQDPNQESFTAEQPSLDLNPEIPELETLSRSASISIEDSNLDLTAEPQKLELVTESPNLELPLELEPTPSASLEFSTPPIPIPDPSLSVLAGEPNLELISVEQTSLDLSSNIPLLDSPPSADSFSVADSNLENPVLELPDAIALPSVEEETSDDLLPDAAVLPTSELNLSDTLTESDAAIPGFAGVGLTDTPTPELPDGEDFVSDPLSRSDHLMDDVVEPVSIWPDSPEIVGLAADIPFVESAQISELPGSELPGSELPGSELPGSELSGSELPGSELSGSEWLGDVDEGSESLISEPEPESDAEAMIPVIPVPLSLEIPDSSNIPVTPTPTPSPSMPYEPEDSAEGEAPPLGAVGASSGSAANVGGIAVTHPPRAVSGATSSYKRLLGGRRQIAAFGVILLGMGGILGYGWSKGGLKYPFRTDFSQPRSGIVLDRNQSDEDNQSSETDGIASVGTDDSPLEPGQDASSNRVPSKDDGDQRAIGGVSLDRNSGGVTALAPKIAGSSDSTKLDPAKAESKSTDSGNQTSKNQTPPPIDISDVPPNHWARPYVVAMHKQGIVPDFPDGKFQPDKPVTRAELAASIQRAFKDKAGSDPIPFTDISQGYWAKDAITHAVNKGFMSGYSDEIFEPEQRIPRYQVLVSLVSGLGLPKIEDSAEAGEILKAFPDVDGMPKWALGQVAAAQKANLIVGDPQKSRNLDPNRPATRAEANAMIYQALVNAKIIKDTVK